MRDAGGGIGPGVVKETAADLIIRGRVITVDPRRPRAEAVAVRDGRIAAVGAWSEVEGLCGAGTRVVDVGDGCVMPGFIEAHGHPTTEAIMLGRVVDIRPVTISDAASVIETIQRTIGERGADGAYFNGWDALLQEGLPRPTRAWLDELAPETPLVILHNSGHSAYFNTKAAQVAGVSRDTPDPEGASFERDVDGELTGVAYETAAVVRVMTPGVRLRGGLSGALAAECAQLNRAGVIACSDMAFNPASRHGLQRARDHGAITARLRLYEASTPQMASDSTPGAGDDLVRQIGIKLWADGSPWIGNIATSFPYLDTPQTRMLGLAPGHHGAMNYQRDEIARISEAYFGAGWQIACHAQGDVAIEAVLDAWEEMLERSPRRDHRMRLEHCGAMTPAQFERAARLGVACSIFIDHLWYWGDVLVDGLFGEKHGAHWARAGSAFRAGVRTSFHNDGGVTRIEPLRNMQVAVTRRSRSGRSLAPEECVSVEEAIRAQTIDAAYQLFMDDIVGSVEVGKYADLVVLSRDITSVPVEQIADVEVVATLLAGQVVSGEL
ncbi:MAG: amidohydrolase [Dehalococcoidia bacterium]